MVEIREDEVKDAILRNPQLFNGIKDSMVIFEKSIYYHKLIADALVFTKDNGILGVEIKTEGDNLTRLPHQLDYYVRTCSYTYVFCHDKHLNNVIKLLESKKYDCVGLISYDDFNGTVIAGKVKEAKWSPYLSAKASATLLWKKELYRVLRVFYTQPSKVLKERYGVENDTDNTGKQYRIHNMVGSVNPKTRYRELLSIYGKTFNEHEALDILSNLYLSNNISEDKPLQRYYFGDHYVKGSKTFPNGYKRKR